MQNQQKTNRMTAKSQDIITRISLFSIPILWIISFYPLIKWIFNSYALHNNIFGIYAAILVISLLIFNYKKDKFKLEKVVDLSIKKLPLIITVVSILAYILSEYFIGIQILNSIFFGFGTFGIIGFFVNHNYWKKLFIPFILIIQTLPFGANLDTYIGFPLRVFTTNTVESILSVLGIENIRSQTIFVIENRAANIDISCSGMKGIWASTIFFLMIIYIENTKINYKTVISFVAMLTSLISFNILRVSLIIYTDTVLNLPKLAEIFHVPLGIIGFIISLAITWLLVKYYNDKNKNSKTGNTKSNSLHKKHSLIIASSLSFTLIILLFFNLDEKEIIIAQNNTKIKFETNIKLTETKISRNEKILMISGPNDMLQKYVFDTLNLQGSILISETTNWRGHHKPEICYTADGLEIENSKTISAENDFYIKEISFKNSNYKAFYWFQSKKNITDDYSTRVWSALSSNDKKWTMVSVIISNNSNIKLRNEFLIDIRNEVAKFSGKNT